MENTKKNQTGFQSLKYNVQNEKKISQTRLTPYQTLQKKKKIREFKDTAIETEQKKSY